MLRGDQGDQGGRGDLGDPVGRAVWGFGVVWCLCELAGGVAGWFCLCVTELTL